MARSTTGTVSTSTDPTQVGKRMSFSFYDGGTRDWAAGKDEPVLPYQGTFPNLPVLRGDVRVTS